MKEDNEDHDLEEIKKAFKLFDKKNDNTIAIRDVEKALQILEIDPVENGIYYYMSDLDSDLDGRIDYESFLLMISYGRHKKYSGITFISGNTGTFKSRQSATLMKRFINQMHTGFDFTGLIRIPRAVDKILIGGVHLINDKRMTSRQIVHQPHEPKHRLTPKQLEIIKNTFTMFDKDKDNTIKIQDIKTVMKRLGVSPTDLELKTYYKDLNVRDDGKVSFDVFVELMKKVMPDADTEADILEAFVTFDKDGDGIITKDDVKTILLSLGLEVTEQEINKLVDIADVNGDGKITFEDFTLILKDAQL